jgi:tetratricopeptide (TPR) repeat protein
MPFVDPDNSQLSTDVRKIFVGRDEELEFFVQSILKSDKPTHNIISISGDAGVGKSTLLAQFLDKASVPGFKEYCLKARVGERQVTPISMMEKFADQLHISGYSLIQFEAALHKYRNTMGWPLAEREAQLRDKSLESVNLPPFYDIMSEDEETKKSRGIDERFFVEYGHHYFKDNEQKDNQIGELTKAFVDDLNQLANTPVVLNSHHNKHQRRILLFFDTFEQLATEAVPWFLDHLLEYEISRNIVLIVAGRVSIERSAPQYLRRWLPYRDSDSIYSIGLESFSQEETSKYLAAQDITDPNRIARLWKSSKGLPLYLCLLVSNPLGDIDPTKEVVDIFLSGISENEEMKRRLALDLSLSSKSFNQDDLEAFTYLTEGARPKLYRWLTTQFFVSSNLEDGRYSYHELAKEIFSRYLYQAPKQCQATRKALADYYQRLLDKIPMDRTSVEVGKEVNCSPERLELVLALVTQLLFLPDEIEHISAIEYVLLVHRHTNREQDGEIMKVLSQLSHDESINRANADARQVASRLLQYIETVQINRSQESLAATSYLLEKRTHKASFQLELVADIYYRRGRIYFRLDKNEQALDECNNALKCDVEYLNAYLLRGRIYIELRRYEDALIDINHALKLKPENTRALFDRGRVYRLQGNYEEALRDLGDALELDSHFEHQGYEEMGLVFHSLGRYKEAIDSFVKALNAESTCSRNWISLARTYQIFQLQSEIPRLLKEIQVPKSSSPIVIACRAKALSDIGSYSDALEGFNQAVKRAPKNADFLIERGRVYGQLARYEDALADLSYALNLKPSNITALSIRGHTYSNLGRYEEALQDFERAIRLSSKKGWLFLGRGMIHGRKGSSKEALQDFDHAIELNPDLEHEAQKERGLVLHSLKRYPEAREAFTRALKKQLACAECWRSLARTYKASYPQNEISKLLREIVIPDTNKASVIACRGYALRVVECYEEALIDFEISIDLDPEDAFAYLNRGRTYYSLSYYEEALQDFYYTTKLNPDRYNHDGFHWSGMTLQALGMYKEAIESFSRALSALPTCSKCWTLLVRTYEALYLRSEIPKLLREIALPNTDSVSAIIDRAEAFHKSGYFEEALRDFTLAIEIEPDNIEAIIFRGQVYSELKHYEEALVDFSYTIELKTNFTQAFFNRGRIYRHLGRYEEALRDFDHTVKLDPEFKHDCQKEKGLILYSQAKYQRAIEAFIKSLTTKPTCSTCWFQLAKTYEAIYPRSEIPKLLRMISIPDANRPSTIYNRVLAMSSQSYYKEALDDLERIKISNGDLIENYYIEKGLILSYCNCPGPLE